MPLRLEVIVACEIPFEAASVLKSSSQLWKLLAPHGTAACATVADIAKPIARAQPKNRRCRNRIAFRIEERARDMSGATAAKTRLNSVLRRNYVADCRWSVTGSPLATIDQEPSLRRQGNRLAGKSAAGRFSRGGRGATGRRLGSGAITLR